MPSALLDDDTLRQLGGWPCPRRGQGSPSPNLDKRALLNRVLSDVPSARRLSVRWYQHAGVCHVSWGAYKPERHPKGIKKTSPEKKAQNAKLAALRAATEVRRSILAIAADRMLTLTYAENMTDRTQALRDLMKFIRIMRRNFSRWQSVSVLEYQQRGACHFHIALCGYYDITVIRSAWQSIVGRGSCHMAFEPRANGNPYSKLASYMAKYLAKDTDEGRRPGEHRYFKTQLVEDGRRQVFYIPNSAPPGIERKIAVEVMKDLIRPDGVGFPNNLWFAPEGMGASGFASAER